MDKIFKLATENGPRYPAYKGEYDFFITPAYADIKYAAQALGWTVKLAREDAAKYVIDMRRTAIEGFERTIALLEAGRSLSDREAFLADSMYDFLHATVAPHQRDFPFLSNELMERWVIELGLRTDSVCNQSARDIAHDHALYNAVHRPCLDIKYPDLSYLPRVAPTEGENVFVGRYLRSLAHVAKLIGPDHIPPENIVAAWVGKNQEKASGPSFRDEVIGLLSLAGFQPTTCALGEAVEPLPAASNVIAWPPTKT